MSAQDSTRASMAADQRLENELHALRTEAAEIRRERAAIIRERAAIDHERVDWAHRLQESVAHGDRIEQATREATSQAYDAAHAADRETWEARHQAVVDELRRQQHHALVLEGQLSELRAQLASRGAELATAQRWSLRHRLGVIAHRLPGFQRARRSR